MKKILCCIFMISLIGCASPGKQYQSLLQDIDRNVLVEYERALLHLPIVTDDLGQSRFIDELNEIEIENRMNSIRSIRLLIGAIEGGE